MSILFAISVISFCALVWAAFAIARHIRRASTAQGQTNPGTASQTLNPPRRKAS